LAFGLLFSGPRILQSLDFDPRDPKVARGPPYLPLPTAYNHFSRLPPDPLHFYPPLVLPLARLPILPYHPPSGFEGMSSHFLFSPVVPRHTHLPPLSRLLPPPRDKELRPLFLSVSFFPPYDPPCKDDSQRPSPSLSKPLTPDEITSRTPNAFSQSFLVGKDRPGSWLCCLFELVCRVSVHCCPLCESAPPVSLSQPDLYSRWIAG